MKNFKVLNGFGGSGTTQKEVLNHVRRIFMNGRRNL